MRRVLLVFVLIASVSCVASAQWEQLAGPPGPLGRLAQLKSGDLYNATTDGVYRSTDLGETWTKFGLQGKSIITIDPINTDRNTLIATDPHTIYRTSNAGLSWDTVFRSSKLVVESMMKYADTLILGVYSLDTSDVLYRSNDGGLTWNAIPDLAPMHGWVSIFAISRHTILSATYDGSLWTFDLNVGVWRHLDQSVKSPYTMIAMGDSVFLTAYRSLFLTTDAGEHWKSKSTIGIADSVSIRSMARIDSIFYAATDSGIVLTSDAGASWSVPSDSALLKNINNSPSHYVPHWNIQNIGQNLFVERGQWYSTQDGIRFTKRNASGLSNGGIQSIVSDNANLFCSTPIGIYHSSDNGQTWSDPELGSKWTSVLVTAFGSVYAVGNELLRLNGTQWDSIRDSINNGIWFVGDTIFLANPGDYYGGPPVLQRSTDRGQSWSVDTIKPFAEYGMDIGNIFEMRYNDKECLFALATGFYDSVYHVEPWGHGETQVRVVAMFISSDRGETWSDPRGSMFSGLVNSVSPDLIFEQRSDGIWRSDSLPVWNKISSRDFGQPYGPWFVVPFQRGLMIGARDSNGQVSLWNVSYGGNLQLLLPPDSLGAIQSFYSDSKYAYVTTWDRGIWRTPIASLPLAVTSHDATAQRDIVVYPNPCGDKAIITFTLPGREHVTVNIYDVCGTLRAAVVDAMREAGEQSVALNASALPNGIYEVVVSAGTMRSAMQIVIER